LQQTDPLDGIAVSLVIPIHAGFIRIIGMDMYGPTEKTLANPMASGAI